MNLISATSLAKIAGISRQAMHKVIVDAQNGKPWRGVLIKSVHSKGRGGKQGKVLLIDSGTLPDDLKARLNTLQTPCKAPLKDHKMQPRWQLWLAIVQPLEQLQGRALMAAIQELLASPPLLENGRSLKLSETTIRSKLKRFKVEGVQAFARHIRSNKGEKLTIITRQFDNDATANGLLPEVIQGIGEQLDKYVASFVAKGTARTLIRELAGDFLTNKANELGFGGMRYDIPQYYIQARRKYRNIYRLNHDAKAHYDASPHILRHTHGMRPMQMVVGDVHPCDVYMLREDGTQATAKMIAWMDVGTQRVFATVHLLAKGEGVTNKLVIESFWQMLQVWGMPETLYVDNGKEYGFAELMEGLLKLSSNGRVIKSLPYNARAKSIEPWFGKFERTYLKQMIGWVGGDRTNKKIERVGKSVKAYPLGIEAFAGQVEIFINHYNGTALPPHSNQSPNAMFAAAINSGWMMTRCEEDIFVLAFSSEERRTVRNGYIQFSGSTWQIPANYIDDHITVLAPKYETWTRLPLKDLKGDFIGFAERSTTYAFDDPEGARESAKRQTGHRNAIRQLGNGLPNIDVVAAINSKVVNFPYQRKAPVGTIIGLSDGGKMITDGLRETPRQKRRRESEAYERKQDEQLAALQIRDRKKP